WVRRMRRTPGARMRAPAHHHLSSGCACRPRSQLDLYGLRLPAAGHGQRHRVTRGVGVDRRDELVGRGDLLAVDRGDRVAGLPIATTPSPTWAVEEFANGSGWSSEEGTLTWITATSLDGSVPTTRAPTVLPFENFTCTDWAFATTCWSVRMLPWLS